MWEEERACWEVDYDGVDLEALDPYGYFCVEAEGDPVRLRALMRRFYEPRRGDVEEQAVLQRVLEISQQACAGCTGADRSRPAAGGGRAQGQGRQAARGRGHPPSSRPRRR